MCAGALFTSEQGYTAIVATGSGGSSFKVLIRDHTRQLDFHLQVLACSMQPVDLQSEQALDVTTLKLLLKECLKLQCWRDALTNLYQFSPPYLPGRNAISLNISEKFHRVIRQIFLVPAHSCLLSLDAAHNPVSDSVLHRHLLNLSE